MVGAAQIARIHFLWLQKSLTTVFTVSFSLNKYAALPPGKNKPS